MEVEPAFAALASEAAAILRPRQEALRSVFDGLGELSKVWNRESDETAWHRDGFFGPMCVVARIQIVGRFFISDATWIWSWAEKRHRPGLDSDALKVRRLGEERGISLLTKPTFQSTEQLAIQFATVTAMVANADGIWMNRNERIAGFETLHEVRRVADGSA